MNKEGLTKDASSLERPFSAASGPIKRLSKAR